MATTFHAMDASGQSGKEPTGVDETLLDLVYLNEHDAVEERLKGGADINTQSPFDGSTLLHIALKNNDFNMAKLISSYGADLSTPDINGVKPYEVIRSSPTPLIRSLFSFVELRSPFEGVFLRSDEHDLKHEVVDAWEGIAVNVVDYDPGVPTLRNHGDHVAKEDKVAALFSLSTYFEILSPADGVLVEFCVEDNSTVQFNEPVCVIAIKSPVNQS